MSEIVEKVKQIVKADCYSENNRMDRAFYDLHLAKVEHYAMELCDMFQVDPYIVRIASYIHDIAVIRDYGTLETHHLESARIAKKLLHPYLEKKQLELLEEMIIRHNFPEHTSSQESMVLSNADALAKYDCPVYWISYAYKRKCSTYREALTWYKELITKIHAMLEPKARELVQDKYRSIENLCLSEYFES